MDARPELGLDLEPQEAELTEAKDGLASGTAPDKLADAGASRTNAPREPAASARDPGAASVDRRA